jgi:outer membrane protein TolC
VRAEWLLLALLLAGCGPARLLTRPDGTGGWSTERRRTELTTRATAVQVDLDATDVRPAPTEPLALDDAVRLTATASRRIAEADRDVAIAGARVGVARARLLPRVTGSGRYTWYTDPLTNRIESGALALAPGTGGPVVTIREEEVGVLNGTATVPLDVWGEALHGLTAAQAGYRAEAARRWATVLE